MSAPSPFQRKSTLTFGIGQGKSSFTESSARIWNGSKTSPAKLASSEAEPEAKHFHADLAMGPQVAVEVNRFPIHHNVSSSHASRVILTGPYRHFLS